MEKELKDKYFDKVNRLKEIDSMCDDLMPAIEKCLDKAKQSMYDVEITEPLIAAKDIILDIGKKCRTNVVILSLAYNPDLPLTDKVMDVFGQDVYKKDLESFQEFIDYNYKKVNELKVLTEWWLLS